MAASGSSSQSSSSVSARPSAAGGQRRRSHGSSFRSTSRLAARSCTSPTELRHQILRYDLAEAPPHALSPEPVAPGTSGDGGPAVRARLTEPTELVLDRAGNLYFSDVNQGRV